MKAIKTTIGNSGFILYIKALFAGITFGMVISGTLLCLFALIILISGKMPGAAIPYIVAVILAIGCYLSGYVSSRIIKERGLLFGLICGSIVFIIVFVGSFAMNKADFGILTLIKILLFLGCGCLGGIKGVNKKEKLKIK